MSAQTLADINARINETIERAFNPPPRFVEDLYFKNWTWGKDPTSRLARRIVNAMLNDKSLTVIIYGDPRIGKSGYAFKVALQVYDYLYKIRDTILIYNLTMAYKPLEIMTKIYDIKRPTHFYRRFRTEKQPLLIWDDGGIFLFNLDYNKADVKEILKLFQILFTKVQVMIITTPTPANIAKGIREIPSAMWVQVIRDRVVDPERLWIEPPSIRYHRESRIYDPWTLPDLVKRGINLIAYEGFDCRFPDSAYEYYTPIRESYTMRHEETIKDKLEDSERKQAQLDKKRKEALLKVIPDIEYTVKT